MKLFKALLLLFISLLITGCYTQLQYSQKVHRITDEKPMDGYSWNSDSDDSYSVNDADSIYMAETKEGKAYDYSKENAYGSDQYGEASYDDDYIPIAYKNYDVIEKYDSCQCDPYKTYVLVEDPYYFPSYSAYSYNRFYHRYHRYYRPYRSYFGFGFYNPGFAFSVGWSSHYYPFYDPYFYHPYHDYYTWWYPSVQYNNYYFFGNSYSKSYAYKNPKSRYGRRSIGADRVGSGTRSVNRTRSTSRGRVTGVTNTRSRTRGVTRTNSGNTRTKVTRSRGNGGSSRVGTTRNRSSSRTKINVNRTRSGGNGTVRSRGNTSVSRTKDRSGSRSSVTRTRIKSTSGLRTIDPSNLRSNLRNQRIDLNQKRNKNTRSRSIFGDFGNFFKNSFNTTTNTRSRSISLPKNNSGSRKTIRSRSGSSKNSSVKRSSSRGSGSSKGSRSSGGGKKRSRGGN